MKIAVDIREACKTQKTGKGQWLKGFISELLTRNHEFLLFTNSEKIFFQTSNSIQIKKFARGPFWHLFVALYIRKNADYLYLSPTSTIVPYLLGEKNSVATVVHDLIAFQNEPHDFKAKLIERITLKRALQSSEYIFSVSNSTTDDILNKFTKIDKSKIHTIFAGPMRNSVQMNESDMRTILCPATLCPRKNQLRLIKAYKALPANVREKFSLVLIGARGWNDSEIIDLANATENVKWLRYVADAEYEKHLNTCHALALPSLYEGFGMQILDSMQRGIPILTSSRGSLKEVVGNAALLVDPENIDDIAKGLEHILLDENLRNKLRNEAPIQAMQFSWKRTVDLFLNALESL